jgi:hypothetical protein
VKEDFLEKIKTLSIIALASDDYLMETLVLKGGNAIQIIHKANKRGSFDIDYSMAEDFKEENSEIEARIQKTLYNTFKENGYELFDLKMVERPSELPAELETFWGGYKVGFKVIDLETFEKFRDNQDGMRRNAIKLNPNTNSTKFEIEISKYEYVANKTEVELDGYKLYAYAPEMIVFEKMRAICQQNDEYSAIINTRTQRERARDFYDIYTLMEHFQINIFTPESKELLQNIFDAKRVPLEYISLVKNYKNRHEQGFKSVQESVFAGEEVKDFDFYFEYVLGNFEKLLSDF